MIAVSVRQAVSANEKTRLTSRNPYGCCKRRAKKGDNMTIKTTDGRRKLNNVEELSIKRGVSVKMLYDNDKNIAKNKLGKYIRMPALRQGKRYIADKSVL